MYYECLAGKKLIELEIYVSWVTMSKIQSKSTCHKIIRKIWPILRKKKKSIDANSEIIKISELSDKNFIVSIIIFNEIKMNIPVINEIKESSVENYIPKNNKCKVLELKHTT